MACRVLKIGNEEIYWESSQFEHAVYIIQCNGKRNEGLLRDGTCNSLYLTEFAMLLCRKFNLLPNKYTTLLSQQDQLSGLQLCIAQYNKLSNGEYSCSQWEVAELMNTIQGTEDSPRLEDCLKVFSEGTLHLLQAEYEKYLVEWNVVDDVFLMKELQEKIYKQKMEVLLNFLSNVTLVFIGVPQSEPHKKLVRLLCEQHGDKIYQAISTEHSEIEKEGHGYTLIPVPNKNIDNIWSNEELTTTPCRAAKSEHFIQQLILSYLNLLVNNRQEIALAHCLGGLGFQLTHDAFTALKKESRRTGMAMYQKALSFAMKLALGGKGYAPDKNCPLLPYASEITEFVNLMQKLFTLIEEDDALLAVQKVLNILKNKILRKTGESLKDTLEDIVKKMLTDADQLMKRFKSSEWTSPARPHSQGGSLCGQQTVRVIRFLCERSSSLSSHNFAATQNSPFVLPSLLSRFKSPTETAEKTVTPKKDGRMLEEVKPVYVSQFHSSRSWVVDCTEDSNDSTGGGSTTPVKAVDHKPRRVLALRKINQLPAEPSKGIKKLTSFETEEIITLCSRKVTEELVLEEPKRKRDKDEVKISSETKKLKSEKIQKSKPKKEKLIVGQQKLTNFFKPK